MANDEEPEAWVLPSQQLPGRPLEPLPCSAQVPSPVPTVSSGVSSQESSSSSIIPTETETTDRALSEGEVLFTYGQTLPAAGNQLWKSEFELFFILIKATSMNFQLVETDKLSLFFFPSLLFIKEKRFNLLFCHEINLENNWDLSCLRAMWY